MLAQHYYFMHMLDKFIVLVLCLTVAACAVSSSEVQIPSKANVGYLEFLAHQGSSDAMYTLGLAYFKGANVPQNYGRAYSWLATSKTLGNVEADKLLKEVAKRMTQDQVGDAQNIATVFYENNTKVFGRSNDAIDAQRMSDLNTLINAIYTYAIENEGKYPTEEIPTDKPIEICPTWAKSCSGLVSLKSLEGRYLTLIPADPVKASETSTSYSISKDAKGKLTLYSQYSNGEPMILSR